jgi:DNA mismatch repair protein MSH4
MAPPCRPPTIEARLELVDEFVANEVLFDEVEVCLKTLPPLDKLLAGIALKPKNRRSVSMRPTSTSEGTENVPDYLKVMNKDGAFVSLRQADKEISALVAIKHTLGKLPALARALEKSVKEYQTRSNLLDRRGDHRVDEKDGELDIAAALRVGLGMASGYDETRNSDDESQSQAVDASKQLLRAIHGSLTQPELDEILTAIEEAFLPSTAHRRNSLDQKFQVCFAVKSDGDSFLDVHRHQLMANLDDIYKIANSLSEKYQTSVTVKHTAARGWHLRLSKDMKDDLPDEFIYPSAIGNYICCTTEEVYSLSNRATSNIDAILYLTLDRVQDVLDVARMYYPGEYRAKKENRLICIIFPVSQTILTMMLSSHFLVLARVTDAVALLDLCHCFADKITLATEDEPWTRPVFTEPSDDGSEIVIKNGRFGIDIDGSIFSQCGPGKMIPNDTNSPSSKPLTIITGINGSGKTMYIKQIAIIVLLAHCGCYVPAESARITVRSIPALLLIYVSLVSYSSHEIDNNASRSHFFRR